MPCAHSWAGMSKATATTSMVTQLVRQASPGAIIQHVSQMDYVYCRQAD